MPLIAKLQSWIPLLRDFQSGEDILIENERLQTRVSKKVVGNVEKGMLVFTTGALLEIKEDIFNDTKSIFKKYLGSWYQFFTYVFAPSYFRIDWTNFSLHWKGVLRKLSKDKQFILHIGSGSDHLADAVVNLDIVPLENVDIVADCTKLPFKDNSLDGVVSFSVLEHVGNPDNVIKEIYRVLKPGGFILSGVPFLEAYHASPIDFWRWTHAGIIEAHERVGFKDSKIEPISGPASAFLWCFQEMCALILSLGSKRLYFVFFWLLVMLTWPIKFLDILLVKHPEAYRVSGNNLYIGFKK